MLDGGRERLSRVRRLGRGETHQFGPRKGEGGRDEDAAQTFESIVERARVGPIRPTEVAAPRAATTVDHYAEDAAGNVRRAPTAPREPSHESHDGDDLDDGEDKLGLAVALDAEQIDAHYEGQEDGNPSRIRHGVGPVVHRDGGGDDLEGQNDQPLQRVTARRQRSRRPRDDGHSLPAHGETPGGIQESRRVGREGTGDGEENGHLAQGVDGAVQHHADQGEAKKQRGRSTGGQRLARADEETGACTSLSRRPADQTRIRAYRWSHRWRSSEGGDPSASATEATRPSRVRRPRDQTPCHRRRRAPWT